METSIETIDPERAREILMRHGRNRSLRPARVTELSGAIKRGEWKLNGEAIKIDEKGDLTDGQHRLNAVIEADAPIQTLVVRGVAQEAQDTLDGAAKRSFADVLTLHGYTNTNALASITRQIWSEDHGNGIGTTIPVQPTKAQLLGVFEANKELIQDGAKAAVKARDAGIGIPASLGGSLYVLFRRVNRQDAETFFDRLATGLALEENDGIHALRAHMLRERPTATMRKQINTRLLAALAIKSFNAWREGRQIRHLRWASGGSNKEQFPKILTDEEIGR